MPEDQRRESLLGSTYEKGMTQKSWWKLRELYLGRALCTSVHSVTPLNPEESPIMSLSCREDDEQTPSTQKTLDRSEGHTPQRTKPTPPQAPRVPSGGFRLEPSSRAQCQETPVGRLCTIGLCLPWEAKVRVWANHMTIQAPR